MKKFYLKKDKKGNLYWCVKENEEFRRIKKEEKSILQRQIDYAVDQMPKAIL